MPGNASRRNYASMKDEKLEQVIEELVNGGDSWKRAVNGGFDPQADLDKVAAIAYERGVRVAGDVACGGEVAGVKGKEPDAEPAVQMIGPHLSKKMQPEDVDPTWVMEPKLDGFWVQMHHEPADGQVWIWTRKGALITERLPHVVAAMQRTVPGTRLVGELVHKSGEGSNLVHGPLRRTSKPPEEAGCLDLRVVAFDCLATGNKVDGPDAHEFKVIDLTGLPYRERFELARMVCTVQTQGHEAIRLIEQVPASEDQYHRFVAQGYEGAIVKDPEHTYQPGARGKGSGKLKAEDTVDAFVVDFVDGKDAYDGWIGALVVAQHDPAGGDVIRGRVSSGLSFKQRQLPRDYWLGKVIEARHMGVQAGGWRHPTFLRERDDLTPDMIEVHDGR